MKKKKIKIAVLATLLSVVVLLASLTVYAYFSTKVYVYTDDGKEVFHTGMQLQLLFDRLDDNKVTPPVRDENGDVQTPGQSLKIPYYYVEGGVLKFSGDSGTYATFDPKAKWGTAQNPYVLSETRHLQNLAALQSVGYFDLLFLENNFANGSYTTGSAEMPYFLICTSEGTPVVLGGSDITEIAPIGSAEHPFVGVIGGAFVDGTVTVGENTASVSTIHNVKVQTNTNQTDVGLFGYVGFLGEELTPEKVEEAVADSQEPQFEGVASSIQNLLLSDVQIVVKKPTIVEIISDLFKPLWDNYFDEGYHRYTYTNKTESATLPHETHHIGILAGHVSYGLVNNINVYYSADTIKAIDLTGVDLDNDNYYSASGILGMLYNMNSTIENVTGGNCVIKMGTGTTNDEVGSSGAGTGTGTGGGQLSGNGRGYVTAAEIFSDFNNVDVKADANNELLWRYRAGSTWVDNAILILKKPDGSYTLLDGVTVASVNGNAVTAGGKTWTNFFVRETYQDTTGDDLLRYITPSNDLILECELMGNSYNGQHIWRFSAGGDGIWHYGIRVFQVGEGESATYKLEDGTAVKLVDGVIASVNENGDVTTDSTSWKSFFITRDDGKSYLLDSNAPDGVWTVSIFEHKPMTLIEAVNDDGEELCIEWVSSFLWTTTNTGLYYFYDGVFTFGLSSPTDTVCDTWQNDNAPILNLGGTSADAWQVDPTTDNKAVVALLKPITSNAALEKAIAEHKQFYISAKPTGVNDALLMSLQTGSTGGTAKPIQGSMYSLGNELRDHLHNAYSSEQYTTLPLVPQTGGSDVNMNVSLDTLKTTAFWDQYTILNIGRTSENLTLSQLRQKYNIVANNNGEDYYFRHDTGVLVEPSNGSVAVMEYWDGFFFFTWEATTEDGTGWNLLQKRWVYTINYYYYKSGSSEYTPLGTSTSYSGWGYIISENPDFQNSYVDMSKFGSFVTQNYSDVSLYDTSSYGGVKWYNPENRTWVDTNAAPIVNLTDNKFRITNANGTVTSTPNATVNGSVVAYDTGEDESYYVYDVVKEEYVTSAGAPMSQDQVDAAVAAQTIRLNKYPTYTFSDSLADKSYLQLLNEWEKEVGTFIKQQVGSVYSIWAGTNTDRENLQKHQDHSTNSVLVFEEGKDYCYIRYALGNTVKYVGYSHDGQTYNYVGADSTTETARLYVYVIEGIIDMDFGVNTFVPTDSTMPQLKADEVVFWPQTTLKQDGAYTNNGKTYVEGSTENATMTKTTDPVYTIKKLSDMKWGTEDGYILGVNGGYGLKHKFQMADQTGFGPMVNLGGLGELPLGESNMMIAPVGSNGVEANVPKGCVAFRVNAGGTQTIRIIVAVPTTNKYVGVDSNGNVITESGFELDLLQDYYIGVWQVEAAGDSVIQTFDKEDAVEKFELPRSHTFKFEATPEGMEPAEGNNNAYKPYVDVQYGGNNYRAYLNGDSFLVAYEFTVSGEGVYVIGSVHGDANSSKDVPMEIVHFSVSGTASAGRDGVTGNQLGAIDFVYDDTQGNIVTIDKTGNTTGPNDGVVNENGVLIGEIYSNYYASQSLLYTDFEQKPGGSSYVMINQATVSVRRWLRQVGTSGNYETVISYNVTSNDSAQTDAILFKNYTINGDVLRKNGVDQASTG